MLWCYIHYGIITIIISSAVRKRLDTVRCCTQSILVKYMYQFIVTGCSAFFCIEKHEIFVFKITGDLFIKCMTPINLIQLLYILVLYMTLLLSPPPPTNSNFIFHVFFKRHAFKICLSCFKEYDQQKENSHSVE